MKLKLTRKFVLFTCVIVLGVLLIAWESFYLFSSVRREVLHVAIRMKAWNSVVQFLADDDGKIREDSSRTLAAQGAQSVPFLLRGMGDSSTRIQKLSLWTLGQIGPAAMEAIPQLTEYMKSNPIPDLRATAAQAIGKIGYNDPVQIAQWVHWLKAGDPEMKVHALTALAQIPSDKLKPTMTEALKDQNAEVRAAAREALGLNID